MRAQHDREELVELGDHSGADEGKAQADHGPAAGDERGQQRGQADANEPAAPGFTVDALEPRHEQVAVRADGRADGGHAQENKAESEQGLAGFFQAGIRKRGLEQESEADGDPTVASDVEGDELHGQRRADIGAQHRRDGQGQAHQSGVDEAGDHGGGGAAVGQEAHERTQRDAL